MVHGPYAKPNEATHDAADDNEEDPEGVFGGIAEGASFQEIRGHI